MINLMRAKILLRNVKHELNNELTVFGLVNIFVAENCICFEGQLSVVSKYVAPFPVEYTSQNILTDVQGFRAFCRIPRHDPTWISVSDSTRRTSYNIGVKLKARLKCTFYSLVCFCAPFYMRCAAMLLTALNKLVRKPNTVLYLITHIKLYFIHCLFNIL